MNEGCTNKNVFFGSVMSVFGQCQCEHSVVVTDGSIFVCVCTRSLLLG